MFQFVASVLFDCIAVLTLVQTLLAGDAEHRWYGVSCLPHLVIWLLLLRKDGIKWHTAVRRCMIGLASFVDLSMLLYWTIEYTECYKQTLGCLYAGYALFFLILSHFIFTATDVSYTHSSSYLASPGLLAKTLFFPIHPYTKEGESAALCYIKQSFPYPLSFFYFFRTTTHIRIGFL